MKGILGFSKSKNKLRNRLLVFIIRYLSPYSLIWRNLPYDAYDDGIYYVCRHPPIPITDFKRVTKEELIEHEIH